MAAIENAVAEGRQADIPSLMSDRWLADATLFGSAAQVRDGIEAWREAGVTTPVLVPVLGLGQPADGGRGDFRRVRVALMPSLRAQRSNLARGAHFRRDCRVALTRSSQ